MKIVFCKIIIYYCFKQGLFCRRFSDVGFEIVSYNSSTHQFTLNIATNYSGIQTLAPSKPQNLQITAGGSQGHTPILTWDANTEPDINNYRIYRKTHSSWSYIETTSNTTYSDNEIIVNNYGAPGIDAYYKIKAVDTQSKTSVYSNTVDIEVVPPMHKKTDKIVKLDDIPIETKLVSNYPNPFNPTTTITYQLQEASNVNLIIYDALGKEVAELVNENKSAGIYNVSFNASNLPSGLYFYKIQAGEFTETRKMLLMK